MAEETVRAFRVNTHDFKYSLVLATFAGRPDFSVFENAAKSAPIIKFIFTPTTITQFRTILKKILSDPEAKPISISTYPYNKEINTKEFKTCITVGRDNEKVIYLEMHGDKHKEPIRFQLLSDMSYKINEMDLPKQTLSENACETLSETLQVLRNAIFFVPRGAVSGSTAPSIVSDPPGYNGVGNDVPF